MRNEAKEKAIAAKKEAETTREVEDIESAVLRSECLWNLPILSFLRILREVQWKKTFVIKKYQRDLCF